MVHVDGEFEVLVDDYNEDYEEIEWTSRKYDRAPVDVSKRPTAEIEVPNEQGQASRIASGKRVRILRNGEVDFQGVVEPHDFNNELDSAASVNVTAKHEAAVMLEQEPCDTYDFRESGNGLADAIVNPWEWVILRDRGQAPKSTGQFPAIDGFRPDQVVQAIIGEKFLHQNLLNDSKYFLESSQDSADVAVFQSYEHDQWKAALQKNLDGTDSNDNTTFKSSGSVESIPLYNGEPAVGGMGDISNVTIRLWGKRHEDGNNPTVEVCRNAGESSRTYTDAGSPDTFVNQAGGGDLDLWEYSVDLSGDGASVKNELGYKLTLGGDVDDTSFIYYIQVEADTTSDTGVTSARIEQYSKDWTDTANNDLGDGDVYVHTSVQGENNRMDALEIIRGLTVSDPANNPSPHWDVWLTNGLELVFEERRGSDLDVTYSFEGDEHLLTRNEHTFEGDQVFYNTIVLGAGSGIARHRVAVNTPFDEGGFYFEELDPGKGAKYGPRGAKVNEFSDSNINDISTLVSRGQAFAKLHSEPIESYDIDVSPEYSRTFDVGDSIKLEDPLSESRGDEVRVVGLTISKEPGSREEWNVRLGEPKLNVADTTNRLSGQIAATNITQQGRSKKESSGDKLVRFTYYNHNVATSPGIFKFKVSEPEKGDRWLLDAKTVPFQTESKGAASGSGDITETTKFDVTKLKSVESGGYAHWTVQNGDSYSFPSGGEGGYYVSANIRPEENDTADDVLGEIFLYLDVRATRSGSSSDYEIFNGQVFTGDDDAFPNQFKHAHLVGGSVGSDAEELEIRLINYGIRKYGFNVDVVFRAVGAHDHDPDFGRWQFDGDAGDGTGDPYHAELVEVWVDPDDKTARGFPTSSSRGKLPVKFGRREAQVRLQDYDITPYMKTNSNGVPEQGTHEIVFVSADAQSYNTDGIGAARVNVDKKTTDREEK